MMVLRRALILCITLGATLGTSARAGIMLTFDTAVPGTIADGNGAGTGFTHRLPGTGGSLPSNDPNLNLQTTQGQLLIQSTHADINGWGQNLGILQAPGILLQGIGNHDFYATAVFNGVTVTHGSDQLMIYAGTSSSQVVRAGMHEGNQFIIVENTGGFDSGHWPGSGLGAFSTGDTISLTFGRTNGLWQLSWYNVTSASRGASVPYSLDWLNSASDLYVGIIASNAGSNSAFTATTESFSVIPVPEIGSAGTGNAIVVVTAAVGLFERRRRLAARSPSTAAHRQE